MALIHNEGQTMQQAKRALVARGFVYDRALRRFAKYEVDEDDGPGLVIARVGYIDGTTTLVTTYDWEAN